MIKQSTNLFVHIITVIVVVHVMFLTVWGGSSVGGLKDPDALCEESASHSCWDMRKKHDESQFISNIKARWEFAQSNTS